MIESSIHKFKKPEQSDYVLDTIDAISENFEKIDKMLDEKATYLNTFLVKGEQYVKGKRIWNEMPEIGIPVGWVNIRYGKYAPAWQERQSYSIGDLVITKNNNGHVYECVENGISGIREPKFPTTSSSFMLDYDGASGWIPNRVYEIDDIVVSTNGATTYHYRCIKRGTSNSIEPTWSTSNGSTITDGSVIWQSYKTVKWKEVGSSCEFRGFGIIE